MTLSDRRKLLSWKSLKARNAIVKQNKFSLFPSYEEYVAVILDITIILGPEASHNKAFELEPTTCVFNRLAMSSNTNYSVGILLYLCALIYCISFAEGQEA